MSASDYADDLETAARVALFKAGALEACPAHKDIIMRLGNADAERHAYALATTISRRDGTYWTRADLMPVIKEQLDLATDGECPRCGKLRDA
ncbi:MAG: hypothetical protein OJI70_15685 [Zavarzinia sp.]|nr:hypothetical protein [Zavarzinia sp.]